MHYISAQTIERIKAEGFEPAVVVETSPDNFQACLHGRVLDAPTSARAAKVLVQGEAMPSPAGRADDFAWPRRSVAEVGSDPVVATTELPMTPMVAERGGSSNVATASLADPGASTAPKPIVRRPRPSSYADLQQQGIYRPDYRRPQPAQQSGWSFNSLFGGGSSWFRR